MLLISSPALAQLGPASAAGFAFGATATAVAGAVAEALNDDEESGGDDD